MCNIELAGIKAEQDFCCQCSAGTPERELWTTNLSQQKDQNYLSYWWKQLSHGSWILVPWCRAPTRLSATLFGLGLACILWSFKSNYAFGSRSSAENWMLFIHNRL